MRQARAGWMAALAVLAVVASAPVAAQDAPPNGLVTLDFADVELSAVIETIAKMTRKNFIYDERVRGRVTIVSPTPMPVDQAYAVFESVLQVKGFTTVTTPGGAIKVVPIREAKESSIETVASQRPPPDRDRFVTRLIPLNYIDADSIVNTLKPLVSKDAAMAAYQPTNTVILTESASNIRRLIAILESIDVETYKEELAVIKVIHADATTLAEQVSEIYGAEVSAPAAPTPTSRRRVSRRATSAGADTTTSGVKKPVRILTDERTNSLLVLAARQQLEEVRQLVAKLDVPVRGGGRIHVYYLKNANAEEMAQTLSGLVGGGGGAAPTGTPGQPGATPAIRSAVTGLAGDISVTADPATNSLVIQASQEGFNTLKNVIEKLDVERPQVLVEALIMEVAVGDGSTLGVAGLARAINGDTDFAITTASSAAAAGFLGPIGMGGITPVEGALPLVGKVIRDTLDIEEGTGSLIDGVIRLSATNGDTNIIAAPHILTSDNEQAEIRVGDNIPIISSRVESAAGQDSGLASSVNVERQDIGVTLRVTPQITEGNTLRMEIFQEISAINSSLEGVAGEAADVGVPLSNRRIENTVVVADGETIVIGGLVRDDFQDSVTKVPWLGDIPVLGWAFKSTDRMLQKTNLLVFLTPHIVRSPLDLERETIRKREEFHHYSGDAAQISEEDREEEQKRYTEAPTQYLPKTYDNPVTTRLAGHTARYPAERMTEIEQLQADELARLEAEQAAQANAPVYYLQAAIFGDPNAAETLLLDLIDSGHDGTLVAEESGDTVLYEIHLGPYDDVREAEQMAGVVRRSHGLDPQMIVVKPDGGEGDVVDEGEEQP